MQVHEDDPYDPHMEAQAKAHNCTMLQWYWVGVIQAGLARGIAPSDYVFTLNPRDPRVQEAMELRMPVHEAAEWIFHRSH
jgi:hypothetical protein